MIRTSAGDPPSDIRLGPRLLPFVDRLLVPRRLVAAENEGRLVSRSSRVTWPGLPRELSMHVHLRSSSATQGRVRLPRSAPDWSPL
jgi:hypothetical protein